MAHIAHGGMNLRAAKERAPKNISKKEIDHLRVSEAENGGHLVEHHHTSYEHPPEQHVFGAHVEKVALPEGHVLHHIAKHINIPHTVQKEAAVEHEPDELEEEEQEAGA
jgi:hypothetical protein